MMNLSPMAAGGEGFNGMQGNWEEVGGDWHQAESWWGLAAHRERGGAVAGVRRDFCGGGGRNGLCRKAIGAGSLI
jgi:hypothetical protein